MPPSPPDPNEIHRRMLKHLEENPPEAPDPVRKAPEAPTEAPTAPPEPPRLMLRKLRLNMALERLGPFLRFQHQRGIREVIVVVGKGKNSAGGEAILAPAIEAALSDNSLVEGFQAAPQRLGGDGARLVRLRTDGNPA